MLCTEVRDLVSRRMAVALGAVLLVLSVSVVFSGRAAAEPMVASYYGYELAGSPTATGVPFDPEGFTAAHKTLPFGTQLQACYQGCVTVTVNDRGPFVAGRELDLSLGAARAIGLTGAGAATVDVTILGSGGAVPVEEPAPAEEAPPVEESAIPVVAEPAAMEPVAAVTDPVTVNTDSGLVPEVEIALDGTESAEEISAAYASAYAEAYAAATGGSVRAEVHATVSGGGTFVEVYLSNV